ncbi:MAG: hypothetical protein V4543_13035 [Bacteroidota bacterium]
MPYKPIIPVQGATKADWNKDTFWFAGWGTSVRHKGIDIFHPIGTHIKASSGGLVIFSGELSKGGKVIALLTSH